MDKIIYKNLFIVDFILKCIDFFIILRLSIVIIVSLPRSSNESIGLFNVDIDYEK